jgi:hypothetical protein
MADGPWKSMSRDREEENYRQSCLERGEEYNTEDCDKCGGQVAPGDWPFCRPGHAEDHKR